MTEHNNAERYEQGGHIAAFHERHLRFVEHALTRATPSSGDPA